MRLYRRTIVSGATQQLTGVQFTRVYVDQVVGNVNLSAGDAVIERAQKGDKLTLKKTTGLLVIENAGNDSAEVAVYAGDEDIERAQSVSVSNFPDRLTVNPQETKILIVRTLIYYYAFANKDSDEFFGPNSVRRIGDLPITYPLNGDISASLTLSETLFKSLKASSLGVMSLRRDDEFLTPLQVQSHSYYKDTDQFDVLESGDACSLPADMDIGLSLTPRGEESPTFLLTMKVTYYV